MAIRQRIIEAIKYWVLERPAASWGLKTLYEKLQRDQAQLEKRFAQAEESSANSKKLRHIIAIERWGQRRLKVALGEPLIEDGNHDYKPSKETSWDDLKEQFTATRQQTLAITQEFIDKGIDLLHKVPHNQFGPLSLAGWLRYLNVHASTEGKGIR